MNLNKFYEIFKGPDEVKDRIHIIGCGAVGSVVAEVLARFGFTKVTLYDFDIVEDKNIANQMFGWQQIGKNKAVATKEIMMAVNPECKSVECEESGWTDQELDGIVIVCPDTIKVRQQIYDTNMYNMNIKYVLDFRMGLYNGDFYLINWLHGPIKTNYRKTMNFKDEEVVQQRSACHEVLSFCPTIRCIVGIGISNLISQCKKEDKPKVWYGTFNPYEFEQMKLTY